MAFLKRIQHRAIISRWGFTLLGRNISGKTQPLVHPSVSVPEDECSRIKAITTNNVWQRWIGRQNKEEGGFGEVMTGGLLWLMHTFPASVTFGIITTQRWRAAIVKRGLPQIQLRQHSTRFSAPFSLLMRKMSVDWWQSNSLMLLYWSLRLDWQAASAAKQTHAPDCTPRMGKPFSAESCGKAVHFLFSRGVVNSTFFGGPSVSLLKGFVMPFLQSGYASDRCVRLRGPLGFCGNNYWGAR